MWHLYTNTTRTLAKVQTSRVETCEQSEEIVLVHLVGALLREPAVGEYFFDHGLDGHLARQWLVKKSGKPRKSHITKIKIKNSNNK